MFSVVMIIKSERERQVLKQGFEQAKIKVLLLEPTFPNFLKIMQYCPDAAIMEMPRLCVDQLRFANLINRHKRTRLTQILAYGDAVSDPMIKRGMAANGIHTYFPRPLKFSSLMKLIEEIARQRNKALDAKKELSDRPADLQKILSTETMPVQKIELITRHVSKFLAFPFTVAKIMQLTGSEQSGASDLAKVIEADPVISANILKVSNTVFFASLNRRIGSIKDAIVRIGFKETKRIVMSFAVMNLFSKDDKNLGFCRLDFWYHSLASGIIAEKIARRMGGISTEEAFLAGLLHDFGIIILDEFFPEIFSKTLEKTTSDGGLFLDKETAILGINHNEVVCDLFKTWKMPETITEAIAAHHHIHEHKEKLDRPSLKIALCVELGDMLAKSLLLGRECDSFVRPLDSWFYLAAKHATGFGAEFIDGLYRDIDLYRTFLKLEQQEFSVRNAENIDPKRSVGFINLAGDNVIPFRLYLEKEGFEVADIQITENRRAWDGKFASLVIWCPPSLEASALKDFTGIVSYGSAQAPSEKPAFAQVLAIVPGDKPPGNSEPVEGIKVGSQCSDLRRLEAILLGD
jgi:HD-like signal output (HDOD) protein